MYSLGQARKALTHPKFILQELNRWYFSARYGDYNTRGIDIFEEDWDNMLILDAARYDVFTDKFEEFDLPGTLEHRISRGAATHEFLRANVADKQLHDVVYVTASPHYYKHDDVRGDFHDIIHVWKEEGEEKARSKPPDVTTKYAKEAAEQYPNKRLLVHYVQPHCPFIGPTGEEYFQEIGIPWVGHVGLGNVKGTGITEKIVWKAYLENFDTVLPHAEEMVEYLEGKTVITADHGQMLGEKQAPIPVRDYGHPTGIYIDTLVKVPWLIHDDGPRKRITAESPKRQHYNQDEMDAAAEKTLRELGYLT